MKLRFLNHASLLVDLGSVRLLFDPWYEGHCFGGGWGLEWDNPRAFDDAATATHLWISHFHEDHFHPPCLTKLAGLNPDLVVLANHSHNFSMEVPLRRLGFKNVQRLAERDPLRLAPDVEVLRFPTTGIDNMLVVRTSAFTLLNFNDCNIPERAARALAKRIGKVDVMLNNYNLADKVLTHPLPPSEEVRATLERQFLERASSFDPTYLVPFASQHHFRSRESLEQNDARLTLAEIAACDPRVVPVPVGAEVTFEPGQEPVVTPPDPEVALAARTVLEHPQSTSLPDLAAAFDALRSRVRAEFFGVTFWLPAFTVEVTDLGVCVELSVKTGLAERPAGGALIAAHSASLHAWFHKLYGTSEFMIGAHLSLLRSDLGPLERLVLACLLTEAKLGAKHLLRSTVSRSGLRFLRNRREEIFAVLRDRKFVVGDRSRD